MFWIPFLLRASVFASWFGSAYGLNFIVSPPTQCGAVRFTWIGGTPPFYALIIPPGGTIRNISIPINAWNDKDQSGDFSTQLALSEKKQVLFSMGDATGVTAGGVTDVMTVGPPSGGGQGCNTTDPGPAFVYAVDGTLSQCKPYPFTLYAQSGAIQPITILVTVPHGESFLLRPPVGDSFNWKANLTAGTSVVFTMSDAQNRIGGTSPLLVVGSSDDSSCVRPLPSSAPPTRIPTPTSSPSPIITGGGGSGNQDDKNNSHTGIIIGAAVGGAVALLLVAAVVYFFAKRKSQRSNFGGNKTRIDLTEPGPDSLTYLLPPGQQQTHYPPVDPFPLYSDAVPPHAGSGGVPPTMTYDHNVPTVSTAASGAAGIIGAGAAGAVGAHTYQQYQPPSAPAPGAKQREAVAARQQPYQHQPYYDPFEAGATTAVPTNSAYASTSSRQTAQTSSDSQLQVGMGSTSNYSTSAGPSTVSSTQKVLNPAPGPRFIVHTDIEDEPIELPPMYSESRAPIPGMTLNDSPAPHKGLQQYS